MQVFPGLSRALAIAVLYGVSGGAFPAQTADDPLNAQAISSPHAQHSVLVTITRAGSRLVAAGERGHILYSDDNGANWKQAAVPVRVTPTALRFADDKRGWAVGNAGVILRTDDGGATWQKQFDGHMLVKTLGTNAKGLTPERLKQFIDEGADKPFLDLYVRDANNVVAVGAYGTMFVTSDGGRNWQPAFDRIGSKEDRHLYALRKIGSTLFLVGEQGLLYSSNDEGLTFQPLTAPGKGTFFSLVGTPEDIVLLGLRGSAYRTSDGGISWRKLDTPTKNSLTDGRLTADGNAILLADDGGSVWRLARNGDTFQRLSAAPVFPYAGLEIAADGSAIVVGTHGFSRAR